MEPSLPLNHIKVSSHTHTHSTQKTHTMQFHRHEEEEEEDDDYIDMELSSKNSSSPQSTREFEFQITSLSPKEDDKESDATFPADDLFYKGKLLPLLLPSRRQMLQNLAAAFDFTKMPLEKDHVYHSMPSTNTLNTPLDSCSISPSQSCRVSCELNPDDCFFEWSTELSSFVDSSNDNNINTNNNNNNNNNNNHLSRKKLSWSRKLIKLGQKLKSSRACLKSFFNKSGCSDGSSSKKGNCSPGQNSKDITEEYMKIAENKKPATVATIMKSIGYKDGIEEDNNNNNNNVHRRSFSSAIKRHSPVKCLSSSSSSSSSSFTIHSSGFRELRRSSSGTETEGSIEAAIAHCKKT